MKSLAIFAITAALTSCAGLEIVTHTPYGSGSYQDGLITVTSTAPIAIPIHGTK